MAMHLSGRYPLVSIDPAMKASQIPLLVPADTCITSFTYPATDIPEAKKTDLDHHLEIRRTASYTQTPSARTLWVHTVE